MANRMNGAGWPANCRLLKLFLPPLPLWLLKYVFLWLAASYESSWELSNAYRKSTSIPSRPMVQATDARLQLT